jgi:hypothetical protein
MPGKLVNTNEVTVYLGGGIFAKRSAYQAREIINRRRTGNEESIRQVRELLGERTEKAREASSEFKQLLQERQSQGIQEIKEPLDGPGSEQSFLEQNSTSSMSVHDPLRDPVEVGEVQRISKTLERLEMLERTESGSQVQALESESTPGGSTGSGNVTVKERGESGGVGADRREVGAFGGVVQERPTSNFNEERVNESQVKEMPRQAPPPPRQSRFKQQQMLKKSGGEK